MKSMVRKPKQFFEDRYGEENVEASDRDYYRQFSVDFGKSCNLIYRWKGGGEVDVLKEDMLGTFCREDNFFEDEIYRDYEEDYRELAEDIIEALDYARGSTRPDPSIVEDRGGLEKLSDRLYDYYNGECHRIVTGVRSNGSDIYVYFYKLANLVLRPLKRMDGCFGWDAKIEFPGNKSYYHRTEFSHYHETIIRMACESVINRTNRAWGNDWRLSQGTKYECDWENEGGFGPIIGD